MDARPLDADNHYYETLDSCTRHLDKKFADRGVKAVQDGKRVKVLMGGKVNGFIPNPTFDPIIVPGCLDPLFRGQIPEGVDPRTLMQVEPLAEHPEYQDRDARLQVMDEQGLGAALLFPTFACGVEQGLKDDIPATMATLSAFNRWLEEDWGFAHEGRLFGAAMLSFADVDAAVAEVESLLERGVRIIHVRPAPGPRRQRHQPFARRQAARPGVGPASPRPACRWPSTSATAATRPASRSAWGSRGDFGFGKSDPLGGVLTEGRAIHDAIASLVVHGVFQPPPDAAGRQHRERLRLGRPAGEAPPQEGQPDAVGVRRGPARHHPPPRVDDAVPRGGPRARSPT